MEDHLRSLLTLSQGSSRASFATQWKKEGKKVIGVLCSYVPEEVIHAAGMLPWRIIGAWQASTPLPTYIAVPTPASTATTLWSHCWRESLISSMVWWPQIGTKT